jgi:hypothetical protein
MTWHKIIKLGYNDGRGLPIADVQSSTRSPGCDAASMSICNNNGERSLGPLQGTVSFIICDSFVVKFCRMSSPPTSIPCFSRDGMVLKANWDGGPDGDALTRRVIQKRFVCIPILNCHAKLAFKGMKYLTWKRHFDCLPSSSSPFHWQAAAGSFSTNPWRW